jgi:DNA-binding CsgD family transcriptional regulator
VLVQHAVIEHLDLRDCCLFGIGYGGCVAMAYAALHPERIGSLVLYGSFANGAATCPVPVQRSLVGLVSAHWGIGSRVLSEMFFPGGDPDVADWFSRLQRASVSAATAAATLELVYRVDIRPLLQTIAVPALVLHRRDDRTIPYRLGREVAALLPNSRFVELEGRAYHFWEGDTDALLGAVFEFLGVRTAPILGVRPVVVEPGLSSREVEVLRLIADGLSDREIAFRLTLSPHTVHRHVSNIRRKLLQPSRAGAAAYAARHGLI